MGEHMTLEEIKASPAGSFPQREFFKAQLRSLQQIRAGEGLAAVEDELVSVAERDGQAQADRLRAALAESDRRAS